MPTPARYYSSTAAKTTLAVAISSSSTSIQLTSRTGYPSQFPFTIILEKDTANEEVIEVIDLIGINYTIGTRGVDNSGAKGHAVGATIEHGVSARDFSESRGHESSNSGVHGVTGDFVGTLGNQTIGGTKTFTDGTGTFNTPTLVTPTITSFVNATHSHQSATNGGSLAIAAVTNLQSNLDTKAALSHIHGLDNRNIADHNTVVVQRNTLNFIGSLVVTDDSVNNRTNVSVTLPVVADQTLPVKILSLMGAI